MDRQDIRRVLEAIDRVLDRAASVDDESGGRKCPVCERPVSVDEDSGRGRVAHARGCAYVFALAGMGRLRTHLGIPDTRLGRPPYPVEVPAAPGGRLAGKRVVVVDDDEDACETIAVLIGREGAEVETFLEAPLAYAAVARAAPDAVVSDIAMGDPGGHWLAQRLRATPETQGVPLLALTAYGSPSDVAEVKLSGFDDLLTKPVDPDDLVEALLRLLRRQPRGPGTVVPFPDGSSA